MTKKCHNKCDHLVFLMSGHHVDPRTQLILTPHSPILTHDAIGLTTFIERVFVLFSGTTWLSGYPWTAGYRSTTNSTWEWRVTSSGTDSDAVSPMTYTNWSPGQPGRSGNVCMYLNGGPSYAWADWPCSWDSCLMCEIDLRVHEYAVPLSNISVQTLL